MQTELKLLQTTGLWPMFEIVRGLGRGNLRMLHEEKAPERNCRRRRHITSEKALPGNLTTQLRINLPNKVEIPTTRCDLCKMKANLHELKFTENAITSNKKLCSACYNRFVPVWWVSHKCHSQKTLPPVKRLKHADYLARWAMEAATFPSTPFYTDDRNLWPLPNVAKR